MKKEDEEILEVIKDLLGEDAADICADFCGRCPSCEDTGETGLLFCLRGKSERIGEKKGCLCAVCPIQRELMLGGGYYCTEGPTKK